MKPFDELEITVEEVVDYLRINDEFSSALKEVVARKLASSAAQDMGMSVSDEELQNAADIFRASKNLHKAEDTEKWMKSIGITTEKLESYLETGILVSKFKDQLEEQADTGTFLSDGIIKQRIRDLVFQKWMSENS